MDLTREAFREAYNAVEASHSVPGRDRSPWVYVDEHVSSWDAPITSFLDASEAAFHSVTAGLRRTERKRLAVQRELLRSEAEKAWVEGQRLIADAKAWTERREALTKVSEALHGRASSVAGKQQQREPQRLGKW